MPETITARIVADDMCHNALGQVLPNTIAKIHADDATFARRFEHTVPLVSCSESVRRKRGFTTVELLIVLAIISIIFAYGIPKMNQFIETSRVATTVNELLASIAYARTEAIVRSENVRICPIDSAASATCGSSWTGGWAVVNAAGVVLRQTALPPGVTLSSTAGALYFSPPIGIVKSMSSGTTLSALSASADFNVCSQSTEVKRTVTLLPRGRASSAVGTSC